MNLQRSLTNDNICLLTFDTPHSKANIFNKDTLAEFEQHLREIAAGDPPRGLIIQSAKPSIFIAGADLNLLAAGLPSEQLAKFVERGQALMQSVADLPFPTVAAIHGACLGGGCELALACDYRIATPHPSTKIGLPETSLGILPAWGGASRLPRLIGLPKALDIILAGKTPPAKLARRLGIVDELAPRENLQKLARMKIHRGKPPGPSRFRLLHSPPARRLIQRQAHANLMSKTHGNYPALWRALDVILAGISLPLPDSLRLERDALVDLAQTPECRNLMQVYFLTERAKHLRADPEAEPARVRRAAVIGAGAMGAGIAQWISSRGTPVLLRDVSPNALANGMASIHKLYSNAVRRHIMDKREARDAANRISPTADDTSLTHVDLVIEAALEEISLKQSLFANLEKQATPHTVLATNTSALSIDHIGQNLQHPERVIGIHFFNPVHKMKLVEVITGPKTSPETLATALRFVQGLGKLPVRVRDHPGFLVNRILMPYLVEASLLFEEGCDPNAIDQAMLRFGMPMGPLRLLDEVGHDIALHVADHLHDAFSDHMPHSPLLQKTVDNNWLGKKSGRGFYTYQNKNTPQNPDLASLISPTPDKTPPADQLEQRMVLPMINEAARCLEENVTDDPQDVDFAMIMGTGFAPFRGGPLRYADSLGLKTVLDRLEKQQQAGRARYAPCDLLREMAENNRLFYPQPNTSPPPEKG